MPFASHLNLLILWDNEAPRRKLWDIKAELRRSHPGFALMSFAAVRPAIFVKSKPLAKTDHPCTKLQGILAKANKKSLP